MQEHCRKKVAYYYDSNIGNYNYGRGHVMKPQRIRMTHNLLLNYGIFQHLDVCRPTPATFEQMAYFHDPDYVEFLKNPSSKKSKRFNINDDSPVFDGLFDFCQLSCGGSLAAAVKLNNQEADIAINWMGGLHHAKKSKASGFCYTNDIVLAIIELLKHNQRVLYVDIDVHHGDGVEEAFQNTNRVMTVSFHKYDGDFFPRTGQLEAIGTGEGRGYSVNVPLKDGITDQAFEHIYCPIMKKVMEVFQPNAIVLQCGADSLYGDELGKFNLTLRGHGKCVKLLRDYNVPLMLLGGGGYTITNVARCWTYETALAVNIEIADNMPSNDYMESFAPDYCLHFDSSTKMKNTNTSEYLQTVMHEVLKNISKLPPVPSVQFMPIPRDSMQIDEDMEMGIDESDPDKRLPRAILDHIVADPGEFYDGEDEGGKEKDIKFVKDEVKQHEEAERRERLMEMKIIKIIERTNREEILKKKSAKANELYKLMEGIQPNEIDGTIGDWDKLTLLKMVEMADHEIREDPEKINLWRPWLKCAIPKCWTQIDGFNVRFYDLIKPIFLLRETM